MVRGATTYRILTDHLGSVRLVIDTSTGAIAERIDYDEFGQITLDTTPGFQPFGFAGGLSDPDTKLVRFGARDYDAFIGRWTRKDPIGFAARDPNLYGYLLNDPVNFVDPEGFQATTTFPGGPMAPPIVLPQPQPLTPEQAREFQDDVANLLRWIDPRPLGQYLSKAACEFAKGLGDKYGPLWNAPGMPGWKDPQSVNPHDPDWWEKPSNWDKMSKWEKFKWWLNRAAGALTGAGSIG
jgi:RHS repeat-associated protein